MKTSRKILSLVTAVTASASSVAAASPDATPKPPAHWNDRWGGVTAVVLNGTPVMVSFDKAPVPISGAEYGRFLGETQPLVGPDGRPGCGNIIGGKGENVSARDCSEARTTAVTARIEAARHDKNAAAQEAVIEQMFANRVAEAKFAAVKSNGGKAK
jgi:hypothetical protein